MSHPVQENLSLRLKKVLDGFADGLAEIRTSRASPALLEKVKVGAYEGSPPMALMSLSSITAPDPSLLVVRPWDPSIKDRVVKAIEGANLGFTPAVEGDVIRVPVPSLTGERRKEFIKLVVDRSNQARELVRSVRREAMEVLETDKELGNLPEDDYYRLKREIQDEVDAANAKIKELADRKEEELMRV